MRTIDIGAADDVVLNITRNGTTVLQLLPPTATSALPDAGTLAAGTLVFDTTAAKWKFSDGTAYEAITSA